MKFHCERCKTKYSISDDRVRGKILKIRCKNCSTVITVREDAAISEAQAKKKNVSNKSASQQSGTSRNALSSAFKEAVNQTDQQGKNSQNVSTPLSLEPEWFVSKDGEQDGPFSLEKAKNWIAQKLPNDELFCWSEGFDDWLPVEKVSQFRGIRTATFAELDDIEEQTMLDGAQGFAKPEDTPKPLFAATMAAVADNQSVSLESLEKGGLSLPARPPVAVKAPALPASLLQAIRPSDDQPMPGTAGAMEFDIGEASRVVNLPALMASRAALASSSTMARANTSGMPGMPGMSAVPTAVLGSEGAITPNKRQKSVLLYFLIGLAALLIGATAWLLFFNQSRNDAVLIRAGTDTESIGFATDREIIITKTIEVPVKGRRVAAKTRTDKDSKANNPISRPSTAKTVSSGEVDLSGGTSLGDKSPLDGNDLMKVYNKNKIGIKMCYNASLKKDPLLKVSRTVVKISVGSNGKVKSVLIPKLAGTNFGKCLGGRIRRWKFRESSDGLKSEFPLLFGR